MKELIDLIRSDYNPQNRTFCQARASEIIRRLGIPLGELDQKWAEIETELNRQNLFILPALPDANENENVRIFRRDSPLAQVLIEALFPTPGGNGILLKAISALSQPRKNKPQRPPALPQSRSQGNQHNRHRGRHGKRHDSGVRKGQPKSVEPDAMQLSSSAHYTRPLE